MSLNQKLELTWIGKEKEHRIEPRILLLNNEKSYGNDSENMLIHGDNLLVLKSLEQQYAGKIKCIYIDPPYNINAATEYYNDMLPHSEWLNLMHTRLICLHRLLADDGLIFVQIDDEQQAYLKVMMDEIFGRGNFLNNITVKMSEPSGNKMSHVDKRLTKLKEYILVYKKKFVRLNPIKINKEKWDDEYNKVFLNFSLEDKRYIDEVTRQSNNNILSEDELVKIDDILKKVDVISTVEAMKREEVNIQNEEEVNRWLYKNSFRIFRTAASKSVKRLADQKKENVQAIYFSVVSSRDRKVYIVKSDYANTSVSPRVQVLFAEDYLDTYIGDLWVDIPTTGLEAEGGVAFKNSKKPEKLIQRILSLATSEGDIVLDSFLGSGTTAAVAHKMNRKWIGIELGEHCYTHCIPRLKAVIEGEQGGISQDVNWKGGGGFKFYELAPSLLVKDKYDNWIINTNIYTASLVAAAVAKYHGFTYQPDEDVFWKQGYSYENDYIFTTDQMITVEYIDLLHSEMKSDESLLICCPAYQQGLEERYENINIEKIPQSILDKYDFGVESYSMNIDDTVVDEVAATINEEE